MGECNQKVWDVFDQFSITLPCWATYFRKVGACVSFKVATKESLRVLKTKNLAFQVVLLKQKRRSATKKFEVFFINLAYFLEVGSRVSLKKANRESFRSKKPWKFWFSGCFSKAKTEECNKKIEVSLVNLKCW